MLAFKLGGTAQLPPIPPPPAVSAPPRPTAGETQIKAGEAAYLKTCAQCHGENVISRNAIPDLRHMTPERSLSSTFRSSSPSIDDSSPSAPAACNLSDYATSTQACALRWRSEKGADGVLDQPSPPAAVSHGLPAGTQRRSVDQSVVPEKKSGTAAAFSCLPFGEELESGCKAGRLEQTDSTHDARIPTDRGGELQPDQPLNPNVLRNPQQRIEMLPFASGLALDLYLERRFRNPIAE